MVQEISNFPIAYFHKFRVKVQYNTKPQYSSLSPGNPTPRLRSRWIRDMIDLFSPHFPYRLLLFIFIVPFVFSLLHFVFFFTFFLFYAGELLRESLHWGLISSPVILHLPHFIFLHHICWLWIYIVVYIV